MMKYLKFFAVMCCLAALFTACDWLEPKIEYSAVDLGLSVKWASTNVGAVYPEDFGDYYAWGETKSKSVYTYENYRWYENDGELLDIIKYNTKGENADNKTILQKSDDVANVKMGRFWRMPTANEAKELVEKCHWEVVTRGGVKGYRVTSLVNGNSIFLPMAGYADKNGEQDENIRGFYWTTSLYTDPLKAYFFGFTKDDSYVNNIERRFGFSVRGVCE